MKCPHTEILYHYTDENRTLPKDVYRCQKCFQCFELHPVKDKRPDIEPREDKNMSQNRSGLTPSLAKSLGMEY